MEKRFQKSISCLKKNPAVWYINGGGLYYIAANIFKIEFEFIFLRLG